MSIFDDVGHVLTSVGHAGAKVLNPVTMIGAAIDPVGTAVGTASEITGNVVAAATGKITPSQAIFNSVANVGPSYLSQASGLLNAVAFSPAYVMLHSRAHSLVGTYEGLIRELVAASAAFSGLSSVLISHDAGAAQRAIKAAIDASPGVKNEISKLAGSKLISLSFEVDGQADLVAGAGGAVGYAVSAPDILDAALYATVGLTAGAEEGADAGVVVGMSMQGAKDQAGPFVAIVVQVDAALGGGIAVSFNLPSMSFSGVSVAVEAGEEVQVAASGGYTWVL